MKPTDSPVVVDDGSLALTAAAIPLFATFSDCDFILDFGESSAIITSETKRN